MPLFAPLSFWRTAQPARGTLLPVNPGQSLQVHDTVAWNLPADADARQVLDGIFWQPSAFTAIYDTNDSGADATLRFPSPLPLGCAEWDTVPLDWHVARDPSGEPIAGPAVLVLDILRGGNVVAGYIAKTLARHGIHGFVLHMPQNGRRCAPGQTHDWRAFLPTLRQTAGDARRARDVIAALPLINGSVSLQGTSLGGFVASLAGAIDGCFDRVVLALTGGDIFSVLTQGKMDAARVHQRLLSAGYTDDQLRDWLWKIEPLRVAHRLNARRTWLFSARFDQVVPAACTKKLAQAIGLNSSHQRQFGGCHYTSMAGAPRFLSELIHIIRPHKSATIAKIENAT